MAKRNKAGKTWKQHAGPYLSKALRAAAATWKPKAERTDMKKVTAMRAARARLNEQIKRELNK